jgi:CRISPR/Cas system-associated endonuclease Cas1
MLLENALTANKGPFWFVETGIRKISFTQKRSQFYKSYKRDDFCLKFWGQFLAESFAGKTLLHKTSSEKLAKQHSCASKEQCCQMVYFQTKNPYLGKFGKVLH